MKTPRVLLLDHGTPWSLGAGSARAAMVAVTLAATTGLRMAYESGESRQRDAAFAWNERHDPAVRTAASQDGHSWPDRGLSDVGQGLVVAGSPRGLFDVSSFQADHLDRGALWVAPAAAVRAPGGQPEGALTLSTREADRLRALGLPALALLHADTTTGTQDVTSVAVSAGSDVADLLPMVMPQLRRVLGSRATVTLLASENVTVGRTRFAPLHTEMRSRLIRHADLLITIGDSSGAALDVFEAALHGTPVSCWSAGSKENDDAVGQRDGVHEWMIAAASGTSLVPSSGPTDSETRMANAREVSEFFRQILDHRSSTDSNK